MCVCFFIHVGHCVSVFYRISKQERLILYLMDKVLFLLDCPEISKFRL